MRCIILLLFFFSVPTFAGWAHCNIIDGLQKEYSLKNSKVFIEITDSDYGETAKDIVANIKGDVAKSLYKYCNFVDDAENADYRITLRILKIEDNINLGAGHTDKLNLEAQIFNAKNELTRKLLIENRNSKADVNVDPSELASVFAYIYPYLLSNEVKGDLKNYRYRYTRRDINSRRIVK